MKKKYKIGAIASLLASIMFTQSVPMNLLEVLAEELAGVLTKEETIERDLYSGNMVDKYNIGSGYILQENVENRTATTKEFLMSDGTIMVQQFVEPVHYLEKGEYKEIDNSLKEEVVSTGKKVYRNNANSFKVTFNQEKSNRVKIEEDGYAFNFEYKGNSKQETKINVKNIEKTGQENYNEKGYTRPQNNKVANGQISFGKIEANAELVHTIKNQRLSNEIVIGKSQDSYSYTFELQSDNLVFKQGADGSVYATNQSRQTIFVLPTPYMQDANGTYSNAITYTLAETNGTVTLTLEADADWINEKAKFPIKITPEIKSVKSNSLKFTNLYENGEHIQNADKVYVGKKNGAEKSDAFLNFKLPKVSPYYELIGASVNFEYETAGMGLFDGKDLKFDVYLAESTKDLSLVTYENKPIEIQALNGIERTAQYAAKTATYESDVINTNIIKDNTITLGIETATETSEDSYIALATVSETTSMLCWYDQTIGMEDEYSMESFSIDGVTAYVNNGTGKLTSVFDLASVNTLSDIPFEASLIYNDHYDDLLNDIRTRQGINIPSVAGPCFKLNFQQFIIQHDNVYELIDADGSVSTFIECVNGGTYYSKEKKLYYIASSRIVKDLQGNEMHFNSTGCLTKIVSQNNPTQYIQVLYSSGVYGEIDKVEYYADGAKRYTIDFYYTDGKLTTVTTDADTNTSTQFKMGLYYNESDGKLKSIKNHTNNMSGVEVISLGYDENEMGEIPGTLRYIYNNQKTGFYFYRNLNASINKVCRMNAEGDSVGWRYCSSVEFAYYGIHTILYDFEYEELTSTRHISFNNDREVISEWVEDSQGIATIQASTNWKSISSSVSPHYNKETYTYYHKVSSPSCYTIKAYDEINCFLKVPQFGIDNIRNYNFAIIFKVDSGSSDDALLNGLHLGVQIGNGLIQDIKLDFGGSTYIVIPCDYWDNDQNVCIINKGTSDVRILYLTYGLFDCVRESYIYNSNIGAYRRSSTATSLTSGHYNHITYDANQRIEKNETKSLSASNEVKETTEYTYYLDDEATNAQRGKLKTAVTTNADNTVVAKTEYNYSGGWNSYGESMITTKGDLKMQSSYTISRVGSSWTINQIDENNIASTAFYAPRNGNIRLTKVLYGNTREEYSYNNLGQITNINVYEGSNGTPVFSQTDNYNENGVYIGSTYGDTTYTYGYDETGFVTNIDYVTNGDNSGQSLMQYDYWGHNFSYEGNKLDKKTYANGNVENYTYTQKATQGITNKITRVDYQRIAEGDISESYIYKYNLQGVMMSQSHLKNGYTKLTYDYGELDDLEEQTLSINGLEFDFKYTNEYDKYKQRLERSEIYSMTNCHTVDYKNITYSYDEDDNISRISYERFTTDYLYDDLGRLTRKTIPNMFSSPQNESYVYKTYGNGFTTNLLTLIDDQTYRDNDRTASYDANGYVTGISYNGDTYAYEYDNVGRLKKETKNGVVTNYVYNSANNITQAGNKTFIYDSQNRLIQVGSNTFSYDGMGNPIEYKGNSFTWEQGRKLVGGMLNGNTFTYEYDGNGMRYEKKVNGVKTNYYYDGTQLLMESKNGNRTWYIYGVTGIEGMIYDESCYYFDKNTLGDVIAIRDNNGNIVGEYEYDAWGNITYQYGSIASVNPFRYRGYYYDNETGFYYLQTRYYDPTICRFINADNYELVATLSSVPGELNMYAYCGNNPIMYTDETGESITALLIGLGVAFLIGAGTSLVSQGIDKGWDSINYLQVCTDGLFAAAAVGLAYTGIGLGASVALGAGLGMTQYTFSAYAYGAEFSMDGLLFSGAMGALGGFISGAGAQNVKGLAGAILKDSGPTAVAMISGMRNLTGNMAFSNVVTQQFTQATYKINATTVLMPAITSAKNALKRFFVVD